VYAKDTALLGSLKPALVEIAKAGATVIIVTPPPKERIAETRNDEFQANPLLAREEAQARG